ncbi:bis(5'-nucleosyl)-tetraphosphatase (symmetrical) YqeK [Aerococcus sp. 1KP-2016]|jgi:predicted HD superfamily hydrolase involved in NAD metabolism|uniref:bis(5'-nucleosyl)-tetraphosphatase (symmetrical) YqeK n=1 Tax=Aerococcus sp. 1KP-2016 TaxID=1981982 RepID=UPI000B98A051|nr:bis(5'-nucleosyl)-tetraphosphatase (symmetrical) YqeK [Aerococcus sp. 1KP-2016]OYQ66983.1 phosphohydrolase [Aerococcus sp. 1KP-2016]
MKAKEFNPNLIHITRDELLKQLQARLADKRFKHVLRVEETAVKMAKNLPGADVEKASIAALLHDFAKEDSVKHLSLFKDYPGYDHRWVDYGSAIWHGPLAAMIANRDFGVTDEDILKAVWNHTIGGYDMTLDQKILFVADYIEPGRNFKGVEKARELAKNNLDDAVDYKMKQSIIHLVDSGRIVYPETINIYNDWTAKRNK